MIDNIFTFPVLCANMGNIDGNRHLFSMFVKLFQCQKTKQNKIRSSSIEILDFDKTGRYFISDLLG
jgi:hypothetical protein